MMPSSEPFFPYFCIFGGLLTVIVCAFAPEGDARNTALQAGAGTASGGLAVYGLHLKYKGNDDDRST